MWSLKTRTVTKKSWIGGLNLRKETWHSENFIKSSLIYKFGRAELTSAHRGDWTGLDFAYAVIIEIRFSLLMYGMRSVDNLSWNIATL